jgi:uncharacterized protein (DUF3084 family)
LISTTDPNDVSLIATIVSGVILGIGTAIGALFARSAHKRSAIIHEEITVPPNQAPGSALKAIEEDLEDAKIERAEASQKVDNLTVSFARHEGAHEGLLRDIERIMRRIYKENGDG